MRRLEQGGEWDYGGNGLGDTDPKEGSVKSHVEADFKKISRKIVEHGR